MNYSSSFIRFHWITLVLIYLVVIAGSFVRITGSGMGCPDWPKCFGQWVPPTEESSLPSNYREMYAEKRAKKIEKFASFLTKIGMENTAEQLKNDPQLRIEEPFNSRRTWTEYVNRLFGFLAGNFMLLGFIWMCWKFRDKRLIGLTAFNLVLMGIQGWFGSIVVASNLVPWTITVHMLLALVIIGIHLYIIYRMRPENERSLKLPRWMVLLTWLCFGITFYQMFLGTQVREFVDALTKQGIGRDTWTDEMGLPFYIHRSFSWLVLILIGFISWKNELMEKIIAIRWLFGILVMELISGVLLAWADMPGLVQTSHLVFATLLFGILTMLIFRMRSAT